MTSSYKGRFAPTPSGPAHLGSLLAAVGSYLQARAMQGEWHVRIDDIDPPREVAGAADSILRTLENYALQWDGPIVYQSQRQEAYEDHLQQLHAQKDTFECSCSRSDIKSAALDGPNGMIYPGTCRGGPADSTRQLAIRLKTQNKQIMLEDRIQGDYALNIKKQVGDFVIGRADGLIAYHLATVVDDALDGYTEIVRGKDQLSLTPQHIYLQQRLKLTTPAYAHLPLLTAQDGKKLAKRHGACAIDNLLPAMVWQTILPALGLNPPTDLLAEPPAAILHWATQHWDLLRIPATDRIA